MSAAEQMADELYGLHCDIGRLERENAKLRVESDEWHRVAESKQDIIDHMRDGHCEYCEGGRLILEPGGNDFDDGVAKIVGSELHVNWGERLERKGAMFVFAIRYCPMCGRDLGVEEDRLRELVAKMARALGVNSEWCERDCAREFDCHDMDECPIEVSMKELGVEV